MSETNSGPPLRRETIAANSLPIIGASGAQHVLSAILGVMSRVREIRKEGYNKEGKYAFLYFGDVLAALQDAMVAEKLVISQREVQRVVLSKILMIKYEFDAYHSETGQSIYNICSHTGACRFEFRSGSTDDKSVSKCLVSAEKYGLLALFKIPPDDHSTERTNDGDGDAQGLNDSEPSNSDGWRERGKEDSSRLGGAPGDDRSRHNGTGEYERQVQQHDLNRPFNEEPPPPPDDGYGASLEGPPPGPPLEGHEEHPGGTNGATLSFRDRVMALKRDLEDAPREEVAATLWLREGDLIAQMPDTTYEFFRTGHYDRWGVYPPATP